MNHFRSGLTLLSLCGGLVLANLSGLGGCSSSASSGGGGGSSGTATADVSSLSTVPTLDLSTLDVSAASGSGSALSTLKAHKSKSAIVQRHKRFGEDLRGEGQSSRAGCEANAQKDEIFRMSQMAQLDRCFPEAMEAAGIIEIPEESLNHYSFSPPEHSEGDVEAFCGDIPDERTEEKAACEEGGGGPKALKIRLGRIGGALQVDMCEGEDGEFALVNEATYEADGSVYTAAVTRIGNFLGNREASTFSMEVDLGTTGAVAEGIVALGDGEASATAQMNSHFGNGLMIFTATASDNTIKGAFNGSFEDPFTEVQTTFTGRVFSKFGGADNAGCAKFGFTGTPPPMRVQDILPFDISTDQLEGFLQAFGSELGIELTLENYQTVNLCPNPNFNPEEFDATVKPMVAAEEDGTCPEVTHTGVECFSISNGTSVSDFGSEVSQTFTTIASEASDFYEEVNAFDISTLDPTVSTVAFTRSWDCSGTFTEIGFGTVTRAQVAILDVELQKCFAIQEKAFNREGMGGYNCHQQEQMNGVNDLAQQGPPDFGPYGGEYVKTSGGGSTCTANSGAPERLFANALEADTGEYCFPLEGECQTFRVISGASANLNIVLPHAGGSITALQYTQSNPSAVATSVMISLAAGAQPCQQRYNIQQPTFEAPQEFGGGGEGDEGGEGGPPQICVDRFGDDVTEQECRGFCSSPDGREVCRPPEQQ